MKHLTTLLLTLLIIAGCSEYSNETECKLKEMQKCDGSRNCELAASDYCRDEYRVVEKPKKKTPEEIKKEEEQRLAYQKKQEEIAEQRKQEEKKRLEQEKLRLKAEEEERERRKKRTIAIANCEEESLHKIFCVGVPDMERGLDSALKCDTHRNYILIKDFNFVVFSKDLIFEEFGSLIQDINRITFYPADKSWLNYNIDRETLMFYTDYVDGSICELIDVTQAEKEIRDKLEEKRQAIQIQLGKNKI